MRILIDATGATKQKAGVGVYAKNLVEALAKLVAPRNDLHLFILAQDDDPDFDYSAHRNVTMLWVRARFLRSAPVRLFFQQTLLPLIMRRRHIDVAHSLHYFFPLLSFNTRTVVTIHDMTSFLMPEVHLSVKTRYFRFFIRAAGKKADAIIFVSQSAQDDFIARFGTPRGLSAVVHHGKTEAVAPLPGDADPEQARTRYGLPPRYILYIGTIEPRKNLVRLVDAFSQITERHEDIALVIAGMKGWMYDDLFERVKQLGLESRVIFPGFVAEEDKTALIAAAEVFAYVSLYEGFGLPVIEALACGIPTVTSNTSSLPEVAGDAALLVDPTSVEQIAHALERLLSDKALRQELREASLLQAAKFTWASTAAKTLAVYQAASAPIPD